MTYGGDNVVRLCNDVMEMKNRLALRHILCPIDLSSGLTSSLARAMAMARARNAELRAVHVVPSEGANPPNGLSSLTRARLMQRLRESLAEVDPAYDLVGAAVRKGDPATQILRFARSYRADLIVMGAPGAGRPERPLGPVASVVIARSDCPVLAVPEQATTSTTESGVFRRILCPIDPAPSAAPAIRQALSLAWESGGRLTFLWVAPDGSGHSVARARAALQSAIPSEANRWCEVDVIVTKGTAGLEIASLAAEQNADVVVIGAPRRWASTTHAVLAHSPCPVLVAHDAQPLPWPPTQALNRSRVEIGMNSSRS